MAGAAPHGFRVPLQALPLPAGLPLRPRLLLEGFGPAGQGPGQDGGPGPHHPGLPLPGTRWLSCRGVHLPRGHHGCPMASARPLSPGCQLDPGAEVVRGPRGRGAAAPRPAAGTALPGGEDGAGVRDGVARAVGHSPSSIPVSPLGRRAHRGAAAAPALQAARRGLGQPARRGAGWGNPPSRDPGLGGQRCHGEASLQRLAVAQSSVTSRRGVLSWMITCLDKGLALFFASQIRLSCANTQSPGLGGSARCHPAMPRGFGCPQRPCSCRLVSEPRAAAMPSGGPQLAAIPMSPPGPAWCRAAASPGHIS